MNRKISSILSILLLLSMGAIAIAEDRPLYYFTEADAVNDWQTVNDGVMGGVSEGKFKITDKKTLEFFGTISLENNGGFASIRTNAKKLGLEKGDVLVARVRGDGREYSINLYVPWPLVAFSFWAPVRTKKDEWIEVKVPVEKFEATWFGKKVPNGKAVNPKEVNAVGLILADKKAGPFKLEVEWVKVEQPRRQQ